MVNPSKRGHGIIPPQPISGPNAPNPISPRVPGKGIIATLPTPDPSDDDRHQTLVVAPDLAFVTLNVPGGNAQNDLQLLLPRASRFIMLVSCPAAQINNSLFMHFFPLNKAYAAAGIVPNGTEFWLPFCITGGSANTVKVGMWYLFRKQLPSSLYFDAGQENGGGAPYSLTFAMGNEIENLGNAFLPA